MELSSEDLLRLNVLLANDIEAIRIDENSMTLHALARGGEARVPLNPTCRPEKYLRLVRELLSNHALGSPGGYPVFLQRWTRMGQARENRLDKLLLVGEPEAITAVAGSPALTDELARRVWWALPTADIARRLLDKPAVAQGTMGKELGDYLAEHLAFETDPMLVIATIRLLLQPGLISAETRDRIFRLGTHRNAYHIGFLDALPDELPDPLSARADLARYRDRLATLAARGNAPAALLAKLLDRPGQTFLAVSETQLQHPVDKYTVAKLMDVIGSYFKPVLGTQETAVLLESVPELREEIMSMLELAHTGEPLVTPYIAASTATGTLLRRKLEPVLGPLLRQYAVLRGMDRQGSGPVGYAPEKRR